MTLPADNQWAGRTLLVFGGTGQIGRAISALLPPNGWRVICASRIDANITRAEDVRRLVSHVEPDVIVNAAAFTAVDKAESVPKWAARVNGTGAGIVAEAALELGAPIIHLSTDHVFDGRSSRPWCESDPVGPLSVYGATKEAGEQAVRRIHSGHVILRTSWVFGGHGDNFVKTMLRQAQERPLLRIVADQQGCPTSAADLAAAIWRIVRQVAMPTRDVFGTFHFAGRGPTTWFDFAKAIFAEAVDHGLASPRLEPIATLDFPTAARRPAYSVLDCDKIAAVYGIVPPSWRDGLSHCIAGLLKPSDMQPQAKDVAA